MYVFVMCKLVEQGVLKFIRPGGTKEWILLCDSLQDFLGFFVMYKTKFPHVDGMKDV